jgi:nucleoside-diphosphate-sugar epimerase
MKILITGNLGYVGPWVTRQLRAQYPDAFLAGFDAGFFAHCLTDVRRAPESQLDVQYFADVRHMPPDVLAGVDVVVHLAAVSNDPMGNAYEDVTLDINFRAAVELAHRAKAAGACSFVFASSCSVYGAADGDRPRTEHSDVQPLTAYARSKVLTEESLRGVAGPCFRVSCLRFATACGMSDRLRLDLVLNDFVASAISTGRITVLSDGTPWRPLINVKDMARAIGWAVDRGSEGGDFLIVNAGSDEWNYQVCDLAGAVARVLPGTVVSINRDAPADKRSYRVDFSLFRSLAPLHQPEADLVGTVEALRKGLENMRFHDPDFRDSSFIRLRVLADLERRCLLSPMLEWIDRTAGTVARTAENRPIRTAIA